MNADHPNAAVMVAPVMLLLLNRLIGTRALCGPSHIVHATSSAPHTGNMTSRTMTDAEFHGFSTPPYWRPRVRQTVRAIEMAVPTQSRVANLVRRGRGSDAAPRGGEAGRRLGERKERVQVSRRRQRGGARMVRLT